MSTRPLVLLAILLLCTAGCALAEPQPLADEELAQVRGADGISFAVRLQLNRPGDGSPGDSRLTIGQTVDGRTTYTVLKNIGGVITIGRVASQSFEVGLATFLRIMGIISINLFLLNLLPVPVLDGGHLVFYAIEGLRGAPLSMRKMEVVQQIGLTLLLFLMVFALYNDISNLFFNRW